MKDLLYFNYPRTLEEKRTLKVAIVCFILLQFGALFTVIKDHSYLRIILLFSAVITLAFFFLLISAMIYELYIYFRAEYILYVVGNEDTLLGISEKFLPECNPWRTAAIIKNRNNISDNIFEGEKLLIPAR